METAKAVVNIYFYDDDDDDGDDNDDVENVIFIRCASALLNHLLITESISDILFQFRWIWTWHIFGHTSSWQIIIIIICGCAWMSLHLDLSEHDADSGWRAIKTECYCRRRALYKNDIIIIILL